MSAYECARLGPAGTCRVAWVEVRASALACAALPLGLHSCQHPRLRFPGQPGVAQRAQALVTPHLPQRLSATEGVDWLALKAAGAEIAKGTGTTAACSRRCRT
jgi:hypothetical protein